MKTKSRNSRAISRSRATEPEKTSFRSPNFDCREQGDSLKLVVYVPGVDATGVEITSTGPDLMVTAKKSRFVRVNFKALHLEPVLRDYRLTLRLGRHLDFGRLHAELSEGMLNIIIPKRVSERGDNSLFGHLRLVA